MEFNATFNNISDISWRSVLLVEKTTYLLQVTDKLYNVVMSTLHHDQVRTHNEIGGLKWERPYKRGTTVYQK